MKAIDFLKQQPEYRNIDVTTEASIFYTVAPNRIAALMDRFADHEVNDMEQEVARLQSEVRILNQQLNLHI